MVDRPKVGIATPAGPGSNNGNRHTAERWARHLRPLADVAIFERWPGDALQALVALHAGRSAPAIEGYRRACPSGKILLVMTGTDLYRDLPSDPRVLRSLELADAIVVLQDRAMAALPAWAARKANVIVQSSDIPLRQPRARADAIARFIAIGHVRSVKDPATLARAARRLAADPGIEISHVGSALEPGLERELHAMTAACPRYRWLGGLAHGETLRLLQAADALVHPSRMEGGANAVIEAACAGIPVLASAIDGNIGLLGQDYPGYFPVGDDAQLAALMQRFASDVRYAQLLHRHCIALRDTFAPEKEAASLRSLMSRLLAGSAA